MLTKLRNQMTRYTGGMIAFVIALVLGLIFISAAFQRAEAIRRIKIGIADLITILNEAGYDLAYENIRFNGLYPFNIMEISDFQIYARDGTAAFKIPEVKLDNRFFSSRNYVLKTSEQQELIYRGKSISLQEDKLLLTLEISKDGWKNLVFNTDNLKIKNLADVKSLSLALQQLDGKSPNELSPSVEGFVEAKEIVLNGLLNYPLGQVIGRVYLNANINGRLKTSPTLREGFFGWLHDGGFIDVRRLIVNWEPFTMVARGDLYFNEKLQPNLHLLTSTKALFELLNQLNQMDWLEDKGVFVTKILLSNKAFKIGDKDKHLAVVTPIDYRDDELLVENISVKKFQK